MTTKSFIHNQHLENQDWLKRLDFYKEELNILKERLQEVTSKNTNADFLKSVEHFQNQFLIQRNHVDELAHQIKANEHTLVKEIKRSPVAVDHRKGESHDAETDFMEFFEKNFAKLRAEYNVFLAKLM